MLLALVFSPPVLLLCAAALITQNWASFSFNENPCANRFSRSFLGPVGRRRLRRFVDLSPASPERGGQQRPVRNGGETRRAELQQDGLQESSEESDGTPNQAVAREGNSSTKYSQNVQIYREETNDGLSIVLDAPGYATDEVKITVEKSNILFIRGERKNRLGNAFFFKERFDLDEDQFDLDSVEATMEDGVLELQIPKHPKPQTRTIPISTKKED